MKTATIIKLNARNDNNGNPRRCFVGVSKYGNLTGVWDEGYSGSNAVPKRLRDKASYAPTFMTTPHEYRELLKIGEEMNA